MKNKTVWTYVVTATNILNGNIVVDTNLAPFYVTVNGQYDNECGDTALCGVMIERDGVLVSEDDIHLHSYACDLGVEKAKVLWGEHNWLGLEIYHVSEAWGSGEWHYLNPKHWGNKAALTV
jgi:hypothetical protein